MKFWAVAIVLQTLFSWPSLASNPNHKLTIIVENYIRQDPAGARLLENAKAMNGGEEVLFRFDCFALQAECDSHLHWSNASEGVIYLHAGLHASSDVYLAWIAYQALMRYILTNLRALPKEVLYQELFFTSLSFYRRSSFPVNRDVDFFFDKKHDFAFVRKLGLVHFYDCMEKGELESCVDTWLKETNIF